MGITEEVYSFVRGAGAPVTASWTAHVMGVYYHQAKKALDSLAAQGRVRVHRLGGRTLYSA